MSDSKTGQDNRGKLILIGASILMWIVLLALFSTYGYRETWELWKVPTQTQPFMDFRLIPGSAESFARGYEPSVENPYDPNGRIFNYPAFWRLFFFTDISQADTIWISILMIVLFFVAALIFADRLSIPAAVMMLFILFSPASMLLYERGNVDLIVFFICVMALLAGGYSAYLAVSLITFGALVKLFPIFGVSILLRESRQKFLWLCAASVSVLFVYMLATFDSVKASWNLTMRGDGASYGTDIFITRYGTAVSNFLSQWLSTPQTEWLIRNGSLAAALLLLVPVMVLALRHANQPRTSTERNLAAFRMGASIYVGTFLLGNNWDYRLAFLVLVVPQLMEWIYFEKGRYRAVAFFSLLAVLISCWHFWIIEIPLEAVFHSEADSNKFWIIVDEIFNWALFASLAYLLIASAPGWLKDMFVRRPVASPFLHSTG